MPTYAVKIGEVDIWSSKPITDEDRKQVMEELERRQYTPLFDIAGMYVQLRLAVDSH